MLRDSIPKYELRLTENYLLIGGKVLNERKHLLNNQILINCMITFIFKNDHCKDQPRYRIDY